jgi:hypothetical protein
MATSNWCDEVKDGEKGGARNPCGADEKLIQICSRKTEGKKLMKDLVVDDRIIWTRE